MSLILSAPYDVPSNFSFDPTKIVVTTDALLAGTAPFPTDNPSIKLNAKRQIDALIGFAETSIKSGITEIKHILCINAQDFWFNGTAWVVSDGTFLQANLATDINANAGALDLSGGVNLTYRSLLHSDDGTETPLLTAIVLNYNFSISTTATVLNECIITGNLKDFTNDPVGGGTIKVFSERPVFHGNNLVAINTSGAIATDGAFALSTVETETINEVVFIELNFQENGSTRQKVFRNVIIPDQATVELSSIVVPI